MAEPASGKESRMNQLEKRQPTKTSTEKGKSVQFRPLTPTYKESCPQRLLSYLARQAYILDLCTLYLYDG